MIWARHCPLRSLFIKKGLDKLDSKLPNKQPKIQTPGMKIFNNPHARGRNIHRRASQNRQNNKVGRRKTMELDQTPDQSPLLWNNNNPNPAVLPPATKRRLNERRRRRNKRMKKTLALDSSHHCDVNPPLHTVILPLPCRYKLKNPQEQEEESFSFTASRSIMKQMSTQLILKPKNSFELQNPIEMHSNILYDPGPNDPPNTDPIINLSPARSASKPKRGDCVDYTTDDETMIKVVNSQSSPYPSAQTQQNNVLNQRKEGSTACAPAVVPEIRPLPKPTKHDIFPVEGRIQPKKKISNVIDETSRRTRMILNQRRWPSSKPMPSASKGSDGG